MTASDYSRFQDKHAILKRIPVFSSCTEEQLVFIAERTRLVEYKKGEYVYKEGDTANSFYIISSGRLRVFSQSELPERTFAVLHNGDSFGEISLLTGETHSATVQALNDTLVLEIEKMDFDDVINRLPSLVLYLSRQLSRRLRTKEHSGEFTESTIVALYSAAKGVGRTLFAVALASTLRRETDRDVVIVNMSSENGNPEQLYGAVDFESAARYLISGLSSDESFDAALTAHPLGFSVLSVGGLSSFSDGAQIIAPLLSSLTKRFSYILIDLPVDVNPLVLKALTQSDMIYLVTDAVKENVIKTSALIHQVRSSVSSTEQRMKIVLNLLEKNEEKMELQEIRQQLGQSPSFTLPHVFLPSGSLTTEEIARMIESRASPYALIVRRIARELGGLLVGLALGSGAALGLAHIGVLKVIEREKIPIDMVAGSSIGALVAGLWASGNSAKELEEMALRFKNSWDIRKLFIFDFSIPVFSVVFGLFFGVLVGWFAGFWAGFLLGVMISIAFGVIFGPLSGGPIQGKYLTAKLQSDFKGKTFEDTWLPLKIIAANPVAREEVVFESGLLADAVRASVSIPGIFKPVFHSGKLCLDGGVVNPIPISVLKRAGANRVIAVNVFPTTAELNNHLQEVMRRRLERDAQLASKAFHIRLLVRLKQEILRSLSPLVFDVIMRSMQAMEHQIAEVSCRDADITLRPTVAGSHWLEFFNPEKFINKGETVALGHVAELKRLTGLNERSVDKHQ